MRTKMNYSYKVYKEICLAIKKIFAKKNAYVESGTNIFAIIITNDSHHQHHCSHDENEDNNSDNDNDIDNNSSVGERCEKNSDNDNGRI